MSGFGLRLENLREKNGYTKKDISLMLGFTANVYGSYEREERRPTLETIIMLANIFDVSLDYLIRGEEYKRTKNLMPNEQKLKEIIKHFLNRGIDQPYFMQLDKWSILSDDDLKEVSNHFEWVVEKAKARDKR